MGRVCHGHYHGTIQPIIDFYFHFPFIQRDITSCTVFINGKYIMLKKSVKYRKNLSHINGVTCKSQQHEWRDQRHISASNIVCS